MNREAKQVYLKTKSWKDIYTHSQERTIAFPLKSRAGIRKEMSTKIKKQTS